MNIPTPADTTPTCFFLVSVLAYYTKGDDLKQRHLNIMMEAASPNLTKAAIGQVQNATFARLQAENGVEVNQIQDVVILNMVLMGAMTPEQFHGSPPEEAQERRQTH